MTNLLKFFRSYLRKKDVGDHIKFEKAFKKVFSKIDFQNEETNTPGRKSKSEK